MKNKTRMIVEASLFVAIYAIFFLVSNYIILIDTEDLVLELNDKNYANPQQGEEIVRKPTIFRKANEIGIGNPPKRAKNSGFNKNMIDYSNSRESSNYTRLMKEGIEVAQRKQQEEKKQTAQEVCKFLKKSLCFLP